MKSELARQRKLMARKRKRQEKMRKRDGLSNRIEHFLPRLKMSEVIAHLAEPLINAVGTDRNTMENIIRYSAAAWNIAILPDEQRERAILKQGMVLFGKRFFGMTVAANDEDMNSFRSICEIIQARKDQYYPDLNAFIMDVYFPENDSDREIDGDIYFEVAYAVLQPA